MNPSLPKTFKKQGWTFHIVERVGTVALLYKTHPSSSRKFWEVVILRRYPERTFPNGKHYPEKEGMPASEQWGTYGWSPYDHASALIKFVKVVNAVSESSKKPPLPTRKGQDSGQSKKPQP